MSTDAFGRMLGSYLAWQTSKQFVRAFLDASPPPQDRLVAGATDTQDWFIEEFTRGERLRIVKQYRPRRAKRFKHCTWSRESYPLADLGTVLPETGDLPPSELTGPLANVLAYVQDAIAEGDTDSYSVRYIDGLRPLRDLLTAFPPIVIEPGHIQRSSRVMRRHYGENWAVEPMPAYVEDGNHRLMATVLGDDREEIDCFVGRHRWF